MFEPQIDTGIANLFVTALQEFWRHDGDLGPSADPNPVKFSSGIADSFGHLVAATMEAQSLKAHVVQPRFVPGREWDGPKDIAIARYLSGRAEIIGDCSPFTSDGINMVLGAGGYFVIGYDGKHLTFLPTRPTFDPTDGINRTKARLRAAARKLAAKELTIQ